MDVGPLLLADVTACAMLAAAAACRGRTYGNHVTGSMVLACLAGLSLPLLRENLLGQIACTLERGIYPVAAILGGGIGLTAASLSLRRPGCFYWLDSVGLALAATVSTAKVAEAGSGLFGCMAIGVFSALAGSLARDMALGDTARAIEEPLYATAAFLGMLLTLGLLAYGLGKPWQCALAGAALIIALRFLRRRRDGELFRGTG
jgi:uncharacterized membrane protein YeiH